MYWIYFIIFVIAIFAPTIFYGKINIFEAEVIFVLQSIGLLIFFVFEKQARVNFLKRLKIQKEIGQYSRDLTNTYNYIGEINRKLDILKEIFLTQPLHSQKHLTNSDVFLPILDAAKLFGKSKNCLIKFVDTKLYKTLGEIKNGKIKTKLFSNSEYLKKNKDVVEMEKYIIFNSNNINNIICSVIIDKNNKTGNIEDYDIFRILAGRALCLFTCPNCRINIAKT